MDALLSRKDSVSSFASNTYSQRKKSPFMAFRDKITPAPSPRAASVRSASTSHSSPLANSPRYFDHYPRRPSPARPSSDSDDSTDYPRAPTPPVLFPSYDDDSVSYHRTSGELDATPTRTRARSERGQHQHQHGQHKPLPRVPALRYSDGSTADSAPPPTPVDPPAHNRSHSPPTHSHSRPHSTHASPHPLNSQSSLGLAPPRATIERCPVVVGVAAMDAMVDGMNGLDAQSYFDHGAGAAKDRAFAQARFGFGRIPGYDPLYTPPLPTPPPGVVLGRAESEEDEAPRRRTPRRKKTPRASSARRERPSPAPLHIMQRASSEASPRNSTSTMNTYATAYTHPRASSSSYGGSTPEPSPLPSPRRSLAPSISDIIRAHAPPAAQVRSRLVPGRAGGHGQLARTEEAESEPEPLTADEEAALVGRSSIDSIARE
ncbi:hypothetical protein HWV62_17204, partial [Athelia sp. TMB]